VEARCAFHPATKKRRIAVPRWYIIYQSQELFSRFRQAAAAIKRRQWQQWLITIAIGWLVAAGFLLLLIGLMRVALHQGHLTMQGEEEALRWLIANAPINFSHAVWLGAPGDPIIIVPVFIIGSLVAIWRGQPLRGLTIAAAYLLVSLLVLVGWSLWDRARPDIVVNGMAAPTLHSFPSGHMAQSMAVYGFFWFLWLRKIDHLGERLLALSALSLLIGAVALSRLILGAHWISDIIAGTLLGLFWLMILVAALRRAAGVRDKPPSIRG